MTTEILNAFKNQVLRLNELKKLSFKYDSTAAPLSSAEWDKIKLFEIDKRHWMNTDSTSDEYWNGQIELTQKVIDLEENK